MKRTLRYIMVIMTVVILAGCESGLSSDLSGDYFKTLSLAFDNSETRSTIPADEFLINEATVFIYQTNMTTREEKLYDILHTRCTSLEIQLLFSSTTEYKYRFLAYANMGELNDVPDEIHFSSERPSRMQMHGTLEDLRADSGTAIIPMGRYAGRIIIDKISLNWNTEANASEKFTLKRLWLANIAENYGGLPAYNIEGTLEESAMDDYLVSDIEVVLENKNSYNNTHYLYGFGTDSSYLILECEWSDQLWYYSTLVSLKGNSSVTYRFNIFQTGASTPLGSINEAIHLRNAGASLMGFNKTIGYYWK